MLQTILERHGAGSARRSTGPPGRAANLLGNVRGSSFAEFGENLCIEIGANPESSNLCQFVEHRFGQIDQNSPFRLGHDAEETCDSYTRSSGSPPGAPFIYQQEVGSTLYGEHNCLSFAKVQILPEFLHAA